MYFLKIFSLILFFLPFYSNADGYWRVKDFFGNPPIQPINQHLLTLGDGATLLRVFQNDANRITASYSGGLCNTSYCTFAVTWSYCHSSWEVGSELYDKYNCGPRNTTNVVCTNGFYGEGDNCDIPPQQICNGQQIAQNEYCSSPVPVCSGETECLDYWIAENQECVDTPDSVSNFTYTDDNNMSFSCYAPLVDNTSIEQMQAATQPDFFCDGSYCSSGDEVLWLDNPEFNYDPCNEGILIGADSCSTDSGTGDSGTGDSGTGDSGTGDSGTGDSGTGDSDGSCDPTQPNYLSCISSSSEFTTTQTEFTSFSDVNASFYSKLQNVPIYQAVTQFGSFIQFDTPECPALSFDFHDDAFLPDISTQIHCDIFQTIAPIISPILLIFYTIVAFRIFMS